MTTEETAELIIELVYHTAAVSSDPWVQEAAIQTSLVDLLDDLVNAQPDADEDTSNEIRSLEQENAALREDKATLQDRLADLNQRLVELEGV